MIAFFLSPIGRLLIACAIAASVGFGAAWKWQASRVAAVQTAYDMFKGGVAALGKAAEVAAAKQRLHDAKNKERTDEEYNRRDLSNKRVVTGLLDVIRTGGSFVPAAGPDAGDPGRACFDRAKLDGALREFAGDAAKLAGEGEAAVIGLDAAKQWRRGRGD